MIDSLSKFELIDLVRSLERNGESLKNRVDELEAANRIFMEQVQASSAQTEQMGIAQESQNNIIQQHLAQKNAEIQALNETISDLRDRLRIAEGNEDGGNH